MCLWAFSIMMMTASTIAPMAMAMPPSDMMFELIPCRYMIRNEIKHRDGQDDNGDERAPEVEQKRDADQRHDDAFLDQFFLERLDRTLDERAPVVGDGVADVAGQAFHRLVEALLDVLNDAAGRSRRSARRRCRRPSRPRR